MKTRMHLLGRDIFRNDKVFFRERIWDVVLCTAQSRYGKTWAMKALVTQIAKVRKSVLVFDFYGDWVGLGHYNNMLIKNMAYWRKFIPDAYVDKVDNVVVVNDPKLVISDMDDEQDWMGLSFPERSSQILTDLAKRIEKHGNDPEKFFEMLVDLPTSKSDVDEYQLKWGVDFKAAIETATKNTTVGRFRMLKPIFSIEQDVADWGAFLFANRKVVVNFNAGETFQEECKFRAVAGKILKQINRDDPHTGVPYLAELNPLIVVEEADKLAPYKETEDIPSTIVEQLREAAFKVQRYGVLLILITQEPYMLDNRLQLAWKSAICGKVRRPERLRDERLVEAVRKLRSDVDRGYRQFVYMPEPNDRAYIFTPILPPCG